MLPVTPGRLDVLDVWVGEYGATVRDMALSPAKTRITHIDDDPGAVRIEYYRYRGAKIATPWAQGRFQRDPAQTLERLQTLIAP